jgi:two-component system OmpR family sensor kinase
MDMSPHRVELAELIAFLAVLLLAGFAGTGFVRLSLRPLRRVAATATRVTELPLASGSVTLTERVPNANPRTGVCQSNAAFNRMLQHVEAALPGVLRARHGCAGSPRTRVTSCAPRCQPSRGYAELGRRHPGAVPAEIKRALDRVESEFARMSLLVDELLLLAQLDQLPGRWPGSWSISPGWPSTPPATRRWPRKITAGCLSCPMSRSWYLVTGTGCTRCRST